MLEDYERNFSFGQQNEVGPEYAMPLPTYLLYKDLNSDSKVPRLSMQSLETYLNNCIKKIDKIVCDLYSAGCINFIQFAKSGDVYFKAECRAQMKARVTMLLTSVSMMLVPFNSVSVIVVWELGQHLTADMSLQCCIAWSNFTNVVSSLIYIKSQRKMSLVQ